MNSQPAPEDFDRLKKLLAVKRHEQPPPGYFVGLSSRIMERIEEESVVLPWWRRIGFAFQLKPAFAFATGMLLCGLVSAGVVTALQANEDVVGAQAQQTEPGMPPMPPEEVQGSMEPVLTTASGPSPFDQITIKAQRVNYKIGN